MTTNNITTEQVWRDFKKRLENFILSKVRNKNEAQDILQEVFVKIHVKLHTLKNENSLTQWVYQIARNSILNYYRKQRYFLPPEQINLPADEGGSYNEKFLECVLPFVNKLPEKYKEAIILTGLNKMSQQQFAEKLHISYSGAKSRVQRARQMLHSYFLDCCDILSDKYGNIISHEPRGKCSCAT